MALAPVLYLNRLEAHPLHVPGPGELASKHRLFKTVKSASKLKSRAAAYQEGLPIGFLTS